MVSDQAKYPDIIIPMVGEDGNAFSILGRCLKAMRKANLEQSERDKFQEEATSGNYDHLVQTVMKWFEVS